MKQILNPMKRLLIVGCGDIARRTLPHLRGHYRLFGLLRNPVRHAEWHRLGVTPVAGDLDEARSLWRIAGLADTVLHYAPPPNLGEDDSRTRHLLAALSRGTPPQRLIYLSTSGVYGDCDGARCDETRPVRPQTARAARRWSAERQIRHWALRNGVRASILRVPGIYAAERLPLDRLARGTPALCCEDDGYTNHIHADDLARCVVAALRHAAPQRIYQVSDDSELKMGDYFDAVADAFSLPRPPRISRAEAKQCLPEALLSFMLESRRLSNCRMKRELHFRLRYPTVADTLCGLNSDKMRSTVDSAAARR